MDNSAERIRFIRKSHKLNQADFANIIGISQTHISKVERNKDNASDKLLRVISNEFQINFEWLKDGTGNMEESDTLSSLSEKDVLMNLKKYLSTCDDLESVLCTDFLSQIPTMFSFGKNRNGDNGRILIEVTELLKNILKLNKYLNEQTMQISNSISIEDKIDEIFYMKDNFQKNINSSIDALLNLYLGTGK